MTRAESSWITSKMLLECLHTIIACVRKWFCARRKSNEITSRIKSNSNSFNISPLKLGIVYPSAAHQDYDRKWNNKKKKVFVFCAAHIALERQWLWRWKNLWCSWMQFHCLKADYSFDDDAFLRHSSIVCLHMWLRHRKSFLNNWWASVH